MANSYSIQLTESAKADLEWFPKYVQRIIVESVELHLRYEPTVGTRRIKVLRPNPVAQWELRVGDYRVLYVVDEDEKLISVEVIGEKRGNRLIVQSQEFSRHESD